MKRIRKLLYPQQLYGCAGVGQDLAYYFVDKLYHQHMSREMAAVLAAFIFREVGQSVEGVGLGTDMILLAPQGQRIYILPHPKVQELEEVVPDLANVIADAWNKGVTIPAWLTDFFT
jgi:20S proteasome alpha/beta subunit